MEIGNSLVHMAHAKLENLEGEGWGATYLLPTIKQNIHIIG